MPSVPIFLRLASVIVPVLIVHLISLLAPIDTALTILSFVWLLIYTFAESLVQYVKGADTPAGDLPPTDDDLKIG